MKNIIIATTKSWNHHNFQQLKMPNCNFILIQKKEELTYQFCKDNKPDFIFFPHWSWIIPKEIYNEYNCVVFHMTDLPFGRGGSPLQNLIVRGIYKTKISAIKVSKGLDTGDIYRKENFDLSKGSAEELYKKVSDIIFNKMIPTIIKSDLTPKKQTGEIVEFERRTPEQSKIPKNLKLEQVYDYIRMLDAKGYPKAFIEHDDYIIEFSDAKKDNNEITAKCKIKIKK